MEQKYRPARVDAPVDQCLLDERTAGRVVQEEREQQSGLDGEHRDRPSGQQVAAADELQHEQHVPVHDEHDAEVAELI